MPLRPGSSVVRRAIIIRVPIPDLGSSSPQVCLAKPSRVFRARFQVSGGDFSSAHDASQVCQCFLELTQCHLERAAQWWVIVGIACLCRDHGPRSFRRHMLDLTTPLDTVYSTFRCSASASICCGGAQCLGDWVAQWYATLPFCTRRQLCILQLEIHGVNLHLPMPRPAMSMLRKSINAGAMQERQC